MMFVAQLSDYFGRRPVFVTCYWISSVLSVLSAFAPYYWLFLVARFVIGVVSVVSVCMSVDSFDDQGLSSVSWVYTCELTTVRAVCGLMSATDAHFCKACVHPTRPHTVRCACVPLCRWL
jgi:MFS family permease